MEGTAIVILLVRYAEENLGEDGLKIVLNL